MFGEGFTALVPERDVRQLYAIQGSLTYNAHGHDVTARQHKRQVARIMRTCINVLDPNPSGTRCGPTGLLYTKPRSAGARLLDTPSDQGPSYLETRRKEGPLSRIQPARARQIFYRYLGGCWSCEHVPRRQNMASVSRTIVLGAILLQAVFPGCAQDTGEKLQ